MAFTNEQIANFFQRHSRQLCYLLYYFVYVSSIYIKNKLDKFLNYCVQFSDNIKQNEIIYFDFETTGLNPYHCKIIEYAFLVDDDNNNETYISSLINPEDKFDKKITEITGIHPDELKYKPTIDQEKKLIYNFINKDHRKVLFKHIPIRYLIAHNCDGFDKIFLMKEFENRGKFPLASHWKFIDTLPLARKLLPDLNSHSMKSLCDYFKIKSGTHRALSDTVALRGVFYELVNIMAKSTNHSKEYYLDNPQNVIDYYYY